jgi:hypothetical protein
MTAEEFNALFTREALRPFQPRPGSEGLAPVLEVRTPTQIAVFVLAVDNYNAMEARHAYVRGLGLACAERYPDVEVVRFGSEAWGRTFTPAEAEARGGRLVESYADKEELIVVFGQRASGELRLARAPLLRRASGEVERVGAWIVVGADPEEAKASSTLLAAFWDGYRQGKGRHN